MVPFPLNYLKRHGIEIYINFSVPTGKLSLAMTIFIQRHIILCKVLVQFTLKMSQVFSYSAMHSMFISLQI